MQPLNRSTVNVPQKFPIKVIQFGTGNFLRAFAAYAFSILNSRSGTDIGIASVQSTQTGHADLLHSQEGLFTLIMRGIKEGKELDEAILIDSIVASVNARQDFLAFLALAREPELAFMVSNTTEAGIDFNPSDCKDLEPPESFPAKLTVFLYERFCHFKGAPDRGLIHIPCELIENNADNLKEIILQYIELWNLGSEFKAWIIEANSFHNTLVDRIVTGFPTSEIEKLTSELGYDDGLMVVSEPYFLWLIEGDESLKERLPFHKTPLNVQIVSDIRPYRNRKVKILNAAHTALVPFGLLQGFQTVGASIRDSFIYSFISEMLSQEVISSMPMERQGLEDYTQEVFERFRNPFVEHKLENIALNMISKFRVRLLPSILDYIAIRHSIPLHLTFIFALLLRFYKGSWNGLKLPVQDKEEVTAQLNQSWSNRNTDEAVSKILNNEFLWHENLGNFTNLENHIIRAINLLEMHGIVKGWNTFKSESTTL